ncbi:MAG: hypothetical protein H7138_13580 [Myxococcales bacterium]|nr:hypothetical protein [Myxococcales bacterium]
MLLVVVSGGVATAAPTEVAAEIAGPEDRPTAKLSGGQTQMAAPEGVHLTLTCQAPIDCTKLKLSASQQDRLTEPPKPEPGAKATLAAYSLPAGSKVVVGYGATTLFTLNLTATGRAHTGDGTGASLFQLAVTRCQRLELTPGTREVFITPLGTPLTPLPAYFSEADTLKVTVVGDAHLLDRLQVRRRSSIRTVTGRILGEDHTLPTLDPQARAALAEAPCAVASFSVSSFAPGAGEVEVVAIEGSDVVVLGSFQLVVDPVYLGMFSIGAIWTPLVSPEFGVATRGDQPVIVASEAGDRRMAYALLFTPFLWNGLERNVRRPFAAARFYESLNPSVGFVLDDPLNNVLIGATFDLQSTVLVTAGAIFSHVRALDGVNLGDAFAREASALPTHKRWKRDWFIGVSIDLRAGVKLLRAVLGTAGGS